MPTYDYRCTECGYQFEKFHKMTDEPVSICPECQGHVERLISSGSGLLFKGNGFYETDYKKKQEPCCGSKEGCDSPKKCCEK